jgi:hypothetical protein
MEKKLPPNETRYNDLVGVISINLGENKSFNDFASEIAGFDTNVYEAIAVRLFDEKIPIVTIYAKYKDEAKNSHNGNKIKVHKFKKEIQLNDFFNKLSGWNFTVTSGEYDIENMEVVNK